MTTVHPDCYGKMYPDLHKLNVNTECEGKVFHLGYTSYGIGVAERHSGADETAFEKCLECPRYAACRDLSIGKFLSAIGIHTAT